MQACFHLQANLFSAVTEHIVLRQEVDLLRKFDVATSLVWLIQIAWILNQKKGEHSWVMEGLLGTKLAGRHDTICSVRTQQAVQSMGILLSR